MADPRLAIARRELGSLSREKTIVLALLIQLFVAAFSSFLVVGLTTLYDPGSVSGSVEVAVTGDAAGEFAAAAEAGGTKGMGGSLDTVGYPDAERAFAAFEAGRVDAVVEARHAGGRIVVTATVPERSLRKTLVVAQLRRTLEALERRERLARAEYLDAPLVPLPQRVSASPYYAFSYTVLLPLLLFLPVFISGSIAVDSVTEERAQGTLELLRTAPVSLVEIVDGKALAAAVLAPLQAALWLFLLWFNGILVAHPLLLLALVTALALVFTAGGVALSLGVANRQRAQLSYSLGILAVFSAAAFLPEHPAATAALLAVDSATPTTYALVGGYVTFAVALTVCVRRLVARVNPEGL